MVHGEFKYKCGIANHEHPVGSSSPLSLNQANDPNWYNWSYEDYELFLKNGDKND